MKPKILLIISITFLWSITNSYGQSATTIYTPKGSSLTAYNNMPYMSNEEKDYWSWYVSYYYPNATEVSYRSATRNYNCHGYAWRVSEGGSQVWIGLAGYDPDPEDVEDIYWDDGSYVETTEANASKISYYLGNHSAIQTATQGIYISKWDYRCLMQHARDYGPAAYQMGYRKYYRLNPYVTGSSTELCETVERTFSSNMAISGSTYSWTKDNSYLDYVSGAGTTGYRVEAKNDVDGYAWLRLQITTPSGEIAYTPYHYVWVGKPLPSIVGPDEIDCYSPEWYFVDNDSRQWSDFQWSTDYNMEIISTTTGYKAEAQGLDEGYGQIFVEVTNDCGSNENRLVVYVNCSKFLLSPNPASDNVKVTVTKPESAFLSTDNKITGNYNLDIYDLNGVLYKSEIKSGKEFTFNVSNLKDGSYLVIISDGTKTTSLPLIVKH